MKSSYLNDIILSRSLGVLESFFTFISLAPQYKLFITFRLREYWRNEHPGSRVRPDYYKVSLVGGGSRVPYPSFPAFVERTLLDHTLLGC